MDEKEITQSIKEKLSQIEARENIRIIYACESGSRAWGFESPDSDYDVRFIFVRPVQDYLRVKELPDFIDAELNEIYDINGWDLKKFCKQLYKSNPVIFEWADSPIVYRTSEDWEKVRAVMNDYVKLKAMIHHYIGLAESIIKRDFVGTEIVYKKYTYVYRAVLAASYVFYQKSPAPTEYSKLAAAEINPEDEEFFEEINDDMCQSEIENDICEKKRTQNERTKGKRIMAHEIFFANRIAIIRDGIADWKDNQSDYEELDQLFLEIAGGNNG
jgi:predicted nucleotidyltransferase